MKLLPKRNVEQGALQTPLERRIALLPASDLSGYGHQALYAVGRSLSDWERTHDDTLLAECVEGAEALLAVLVELRSR